MRSNPKSLYRRKHYHFEYKTQSIGEIMTKIGLVIDIPFSVPFTEGILQRLKDDFSLLSKDIVFFGEHPRSSIRPLSELDEFAGQVIDLREKNPKKSGKIRIAFDLRSASMWDLSQQGIGHNARAQVEALKKYSNELDITILYDKKIGIKDNIKMLDLPMIPFDDFEPDNFDILHLTDMLSKPDELKFLPEKADNVKVAANFYDTIPIFFDEGYFKDDPEKRDNYYTRLNEIKKRVDSYLTISEASKRDMIEHVHIDGSKITTMWAGISEKFLENSPKEMDSSSKSMIDPDKPYFLYVGSHDYRKRVDLLFRAFNKIHKELNGNIQLVLAGFYLDGFENFLPKMRAESYTIPDIHVLRYVPEDTLIHLYQNAQALIFPSLYEGFGLPIVEAMACGCPVAAFHNSAIPEVAGDAAILVKNADHNALAEAALKIMRDADLRKSLREKGYVRAKNFTWEKAADITYQTYLKTLGKSPNIELEKIEIEESVPSPLFVSTPDEKEVEYGDPSDIKVTVEGAFLDKSGYALHSRQMVLGLDALGADVKLNMLWFAGAPDIQTVDPLTPRDENAIYLTRSTGEIQKYITPVEPEKAKRIIELTQRDCPPEGRTLVANLPADTPKDHIYKRIRERNEGFEKYVGYTMFEMADLPKGWVEGCSCMDEIWVPSIFNLETFSNAGVPSEKMKLVPLGVDDKLYQPDSVVPMQIPGLKGFNFLSIFQWTKRKGWDILLKAYLKTFTQQEDVALVIRSYHSASHEVESKVRDYITSLGYEISKIPRISVISAPIASAHMPNLYKACQAFVLPTRGEGWGLPYMEAMTMGMPVIGTRFSAHLEFMNDKNSYLIDNLGTELVDDEQIADSELYRGTSWAMPSLEHTAELMRHVYENYSEAKEKGVLARKDILANWTVENQVAKTAEALLDKPLRKSNQETQKEAERVEINLKAEPFDKPKSSRIVEAPAFIKSTGDKPLRVAMQNRPQTFDAPGGDTVVMQQLKRGLEKLGVEVDYVLKLEDLSKYDLVHVFNFALSDMVKLFAENAESQKKPIVITPMYEDWPGFINPSFKLYYLFKEYIEKGQPRGQFNEIMAPLKRLKRHHRADNSFNVKLAGAITPSGTQEAARIKSDYPYARNVLPVYLGCDITETEVDAEMFRNETGIREEFVLCVGRIETRKNQLMLMKALEDEDIPLVFVSGGYTYQTPYLDLVRKFNRRGPTYLLDRLSDEMLTSAYKAAKVHALPSWYELPGMVSVEAAHYDCNVAASPRGTIEDYLGDYGYYAEPDDPEAIREAVLNAFKNPVDPGLKKYVKRFTWMASAKSTLEIYRKVLSEDGKVKEILEDAVRMRTSGDMNNALKKYEDALEIHSHNREALTSAAEIYALNRDAKSNTLTEKLETMLRERGEKCEPRIPRKLEENFVFEEIEAESVPDASDEIEKAFTMISAGVYHDAEIILKEKLVKSESDYNALYGMGKVEFLRGNYENAKEYLEKSVQSRTTGENLILLAETLEKMHLVDEAMKNLDKVKMLPGINGGYDFEINRLRGHCLLKKGQLNEAETCYRSALELDSKSEKPYLGLGSLQLLRKDFNSAEEYYKKALVMKPDCDKAYLGLSLIDLERNNPEEALAHTVSALEINLENKQTVMTCIRAAHQSGKLETAEKYLSKYIQLHPANIEILYSLAGIRYTLGDREGALQAAEQALLFNPDHEPTVELIESMG